MSRDEFAGDRLATGNGIEPWAGARIGATCVGHNRSHEQSAVSGAVLRPCLRPAVCPLQPFLAYGPGTVRRPHRHDRIDRHIGSRLLAVRAAVPRGLVLADGGSPAVCHGRFHPPGALDDARDLEHQADGPDADELADRRHADLRRNFRHPDPGRADVGADRGRNGGGRGGRHRGGVEPQGAQAGLGRSGPSRSRSAPR